LLGAHLPLASALPFVALLAAIALLPLVAPRWWHPNRNKAAIAVVVSLPVLWHLGIALGEPGRAVLGEKLHEYVGFIVVIGALFVITGGIHVQGSLSGTPLGNTGMLGLGAVLANLLGTTGASVLLIRPLLRANRSRQRTAHIVIFFIFLVANCGGLLTPVGDPPLLLGFLKGVPFEWTLRLWPQWLTMTASLLVIFNVWDQWTLDREERERPGSQLEQVMVHEPLRVRGGVSVAALGTVLLTIIAAGKAAAAGRPWAAGTQEAVLVALTLTAYGATASEHRERNAFTFGLLAAISTGAVFMGANTYIGNAPNFMVKAIAEENGIKMPSFFGYMAYSCGILLPIFVAVTLLFFRP